MIEADLHIHSIRSSCGFHTLLEIVDIMRDKGVSTFALTDHGPLHKTPRSHFSVLLRRVPREIKGVRVLKGIEATIIDLDGGIDMQVYEGAPYDIVLAGIHEYGEFAKGVSVETATRAVTNVLRTHPEVKIITHPFYRQYPLDLDALTDVACETGTALEVNNAYLLTGKADTDALARMLDLAKAKGTLIAVNSDGHVFNEMGEFDLALDFMKEWGLDNFTIVNRTLASTMEFLGIE